MLRRAINMNNGINDKWMGYSLFLYMFVFSPGV